MTWTYRIRSSVMSVFAWSAGGTDRRGTLALRA
jgi:hypothetical protein